MIYFISTIYSKIGLGDGNIEDDKILAIDCAAILESLKQFQVNIFIIKNKY